MGNMSLGGSSGGGRHSQSERDKVIRRKNLQILITHYKRDNIPVPKNVKRDLERTYE